MSVVNYETISNLKSNLNQHLEYWIKFCKNAYFEKFSNFHILYNNWSHSVNNRSIGSKKFPLSLDDQKNHYREKFHFHNFKYILKTPK